MLCSHCEITLIDIIAVCLIETATFTGTSPREPSLPNDYQCQWLLPNQVRAINSA